MELIIAIAVSVAWHLDARNPIKLEVPDWTAKRTADDRNTEVAVLAEDQPPIKPKDDSPVVDTVPADEIGKAFDQADQRVTFEATSFLDSELNKEVARQMVDAAQLHWTLYQTVRADPSPKQHEHLAKMDYFFAVWPKLPQLIRDKTVKVDVHPRRDRAKVHGGVITYAYSLYSSTLKSTFHLPDWVVSLDLSDAGIAPALLAEVARTGRESMRRAFPK